MTMLEDLREVDDARAAWARLNDDVSWKHLSLLCVNFVSSYKNEIRTHAEQIERDARDDRQRLPAGWRIEVRESESHDKKGVFGLIVYGTPDVGAFVVDRDTDHKSEVRAEVIAQLHAAMSKEGE